MAENWNPPSAVKAALDHLQRKFTEPDPDPLAWARRIVARYQRREQVAAATLQMACEALRIPYPPKKETPHGE